MEGRELFTIFFGAITALFASVVVWYFSQDRIVRNQEERESSQALDARVERLRSSLAEAISLISQIEQDIQEGQHRIKQVQSELELYENAKQVSKQEADAISSMVYAQLTRDQKSERRKALLTNFLLSFIFFLLGVAATAYMD